MTKLRIEKNQMVSERDERTAIIEKLEAELERLRGDCEATFKGLNLKFYFSLRFSGSNFYVCFLLSMVGS